MYFVVESEERH